MDQPPRLTRREMLVGVLAVMAFPAMASAHKPSARPHKLKARLAEIEKASGGRLGCAVLDTATERVVSHRGNDRFPMCSTFKASAAALVLHRVDRGLERLDRRIPILERDILSYAPITKQHVGGEMSVAELCAAAITLSDNTAANLLLASFGGPAALTEFWRSIGDDVTRLDRIEPDLNEGKPGDPRDTTSPRAMLENLNKFILGDVLKPPSRDILTKWLIANQTGDARLRAGLPHDWTVGDKTGNGGHGTTNDIAVIWPPNRKPFLVTVYYTEGPASDETRNAVLADVGRAVADKVSATR